MTSVPEFHFALRPDVETLCAAENVKLEAAGSSSRLKPSDFGPQRADPEATGYDVRCAAIDGVTLKPGCYVKIPLGFRMYAPPGWWLSLAPRSSTFIKRHIHALYGVIDETYENEMVFVGQYIPDACQLITPSHKVHIEFGERIAQVIPVPRQEMSVHLVTPAEIEMLYAERNASRGAGGFGSSGKL
ncbi:MAG TPA: hypothetical protein VM577_19300 [Anaerovoracaceae bacterium]|nr:hypothetical protein [Anaerovoracaceae bacterium]